jgi:hypothetical protein
MALRGGVPGIREIDAKNKIDANSILSLTRNRTKRRIMDMEKKELEQVEDEATEVLAVRFPLSHLRTVRAIAKDEDRTKGSVVREAVRKFLERKKR